MEPTINWITFGTDLSDYRPAIGLDGQTVIFERTLYNPDKTVNKKVTLYRMTSLDDQYPEPFLPDDTNALTRPDWCWGQNKIAFNSAITEKKVHTVDSVLTGSIF